MKPAAQTFHTDGSKSQSFYAIVVSSKIDKSPLLHFIQVRFYGKLGLLKIFMLTIQAGIGLVGGGAVAPPIFGKVRA